MQFIFGDTGDYFPLSLPLSFSHSLWSDRLLLPCPSKWTACIVTSQDSVLAESSYLHSTLDLQLFFANQEAFYIFFLCRTLPFCAHQEVFYIKLEYWNSEKCVRFLWRQENYLSRMVYSTTKHKYGGDLNNKHLNKELLFVQYSNGGLNTGQNSVQHSNGIPTLATIWQTNNFWSFEYQTSSIFRSPLTF